MNESPRDVHALVDLLRRRWRRRQLGQGIARALLVSLLAANTVITLWLSFALPSAFLLAGTIGCVLVLAGSLGWFVVRPALRKMPDRQVALFVEERVPGLEDRLNAAVELGGRPQGVPESVLVERLMDDAAHRVRAIELSGVLDRAGQRRLSLAAAAVSVVFLLLGYGSFDRLRVAGMTAGFDRIARIVRPALTVAPGDAEIEKGGAQEIVVELRDDVQEGVLLHFQVGAGPWQQLVLPKRPDGAAFYHVFSDVQEPIRYYAAAGPNRSDEFGIRLYEFPRVGGIHLTYRYPSYTGLPPRVEEDAGDIRGLKGSTVVVAVEATGAVERAELVFEDGRRLRLRQGGPGRFTASIPLEAPGTYLVQLTDGQGKQNKFPEVYLIEPVEDERPQISIVEPRRDVRANAVEEVRVAVSVRDDYGVRGARLRYTINAGEEQTVELAGDGRATELAGEHLFYLEDHRLVPGDVISYHVEAADNFHPEPEVSDLYFIEVLPFDRRFSQANNAGAMSGGGGQPSGAVLSQQQIISATWNLHRERGQTEAARFEQARRALTRAQVNLKENLEQRLNSTAFSLELRTDGTNREIARLLRQAAGEMEKAAAELERDRLREALVPERQALNFLLRADALNKEQQVAMNRQQQSGSPGGANEERMTELMDLELDISKDKYEVRPQGGEQQAGQQQAMDEALQRIRELARRQEALAQRNRQEPVLGEDRRRHVEQLRREQEELRRQAEQLANQMRRMEQGGQQQSDALRQQMERLTESMRRAEESLDGGDPSGAASGQQRAARELERMAEQLEQQSGGRPSGEEMARQIERMQAREEALARQLEQAGRARGGETGEPSGQEGGQARPGGARPDPAELRRMREERAEAMEELERLEQQAARLERGGAAGGEEEARAARELVARLRSGELERRMRESGEALAQGELDRAARAQREIQAGLDELERPARRLAGRDGTDEAERLAESLDAVRELRRRLEAMRDGRSGEPSRQQAERGGQRGEPQQGGQPQGDQPSGGGQQGEAQQSGQRSGESGRGGGRDGAEEALDRLERAVGDDDALQDQVRGLRTQLGRADHTGTLLDDEGAKTFFDRRVFDALSQLEAELARAAGAALVRQKLHGARRAEVPREYQQLVDRYYESLSKSGNRE